MDVALLKAVVEELRPLLIGGRITALSSPASREIVLEVRAPARRRHFLLISADSALSRIHLVSRPPADPAVPAAFGQLVKKHLIHGLVEDLTVAPWERVVALDIAAAGDSAAHRRYLLVAELMGKRPNILLTDAVNGAVLVAARTAPASQRTGRVFVQGSPYVPPPRAPGLGLHEDPPEGWQALAEAVATQGNGWKRLVERFSGLSPLLAREILEQAELAGRAGQSAHSGSALCQAVSALVRRVEESRFDPAVYYDGSTGKPCSLVAFPLSSYNRYRLERYASANEAAQAFYGEMVAMLALERKRSRLGQTVARYIRRLEGTLSKVTEALVAASEAEKLRRRGHLLLANFPRLERGMSSISVPDEYDPARVDVTIELDPALQPSDNAARYFARAAKAERGRGVLGERQRRFEAELGYFKDVACRLHGSLDDGQLNALEEELRARGYVGRTRADQARRGRPQGLVRHPYRTFSSPDGRRILVGRSSAGNEYITCELASREDLFLHVLGMPGSHVIVRNPRRLRSIPRSVIELAAVLAAHYSRARRDPRVRVGYTFRKYVSKPKGAKSGMVRLSRFSTVWVDPSDFERLGLRELDVEKCGEEAL